MRTFVSSALLLKFSTTSAPTGTDRAQGRRQWYEQL